MKSTISGVNTFCSVLALLDTFGHLWAVYPLFLHDRGETTTLRDPSEHFWPEWPKVFRSVKKGVFSCFFTFLGRFEILGPFLGSFLGSFWTSFLGPFCRLTPCLIMVIEGGHFRTPRGGSKKLFQKLPSKRVVFWNQTCGFLSGKVRTFRVDFPEKRVFFHFFPGSFLNRFGHDN